MPVEIWIVAIPDGDLSQGDSVSLWVRLLCVSFFPYFTHQEEVKDRSIVSMPVSLPAYSSPEFLVATFRTSATRDGPNFFGEKQSKEQQSG